MPLSVRRVADSLSGTRLDTRRRASTALLFAVSAIGAVAPSANAAQPVQLAPVEVIGATPVPGADVPREYIPANVQTIDASTIRSTHSLSLPELMMNRLPSVNVNEAQGNPYQMDVSYRGYTASPMLGTPQGLSVYQDGVRVNEPFGDVVNWDLIPLFAIEGLTLVPGSNPLFGLNTLGGALVLQTKSGLTSPGTEASLSGGSFGRRRLELAHGAKSGSLHAFAALTGFEENGWRDASPSRVHNFFGKLGQRTAKMEWDLALTYGKSNLVGNGLLPEPMLAARREQIYTRPDITRNEMAMAALNASYWITDDQKISGLLYQRRNRTATLNGDVNDAFQDLPDPNGVEHRTQTRQRSDGMTLQWSRPAARQQSVLGAAYDRSRSRFTQTEADGSFDATRAVVPAGDPQVDAQLRGSTRNASVYLTHTHELTTDVHLTASARYNVTRVETVDELNGNAVPNLNADFTYRKLNPALGATWQAMPALALYAGYSQGNRAPSPIELGCADPARPCTLPNALQSDPFLKQVVARTLEIGARGTLPQDMRWNAALFHAQNTDDILFVGTSTSASRGFFQNFGRTRRQGAELALSGRASLFEWHASYSHVRATFESGACVVSLSNSTAGASPACAAQQIEVKPGNLIPGVPLHNFKLNVVARPAASWTVGSTLTAYSSQYVRGNENNAHAPDGAAFNGSGKLGGYALLDLYTTYDLGAAWQVFAKVTNVFDREYASAGQLGRSAFDAQGSFIPDANNWTHQQFVGPGAPRAGWIGVRYRLRAR
ncbi:MAG: TonB-dependent receptor [Betaproteobacteria bacterium]|nr:TonB-dependent receptor [Betaproteobacteria bacterium]